MAVDNIEDKTDETTLEFIDTDITRLILKRRRASKMLSTYINGYFHEDRVDFDGRMRGRFHLTGTRTGRLSSTDPNLGSQNIGSLCGDIEVNSTVNSGETFSQWL